MTDILELTIAELGALYRQKAVSPVEVTGMVLAKAEREQGRLNAFITLMREQALTAARAAEQVFLEERPAHPLAGIPISVKDLFYTKGVRTTCGSRILRDFLPDYNAAVVDSLEACGAVIFGKANMLEFAYGIVHPDYGQCNNPYDPTRTAGGSSSGSAASVVAGIGYASLGTDTGGSIRIPASYCGAVGVKPTYGLVSTYGVFPLSWSLDHVGPIARTVADAALVLDAILGYDPRDPYSDARADWLGKGLTGEVPPRRGVLGLFPAADLAGVEPEVQECFKHALNTLADLGYTYVEAALPPAKKFEDTLMRVLLPEATHIHRRWLDRAADYAPMTYQQLAAGAEAKATAYLAGLGEQKSVRLAVSRALDPVDAIVSPTVSFPAPAEDPAIGDEGMDEMVFTGLFNLSGHPAVTVPCGFTQAGLPVGIQFAGRLFGDRRLLELARGFEEAHRRT